MEQDIIRELKISEFNRTLSFLSKAIEIEEQMKEMGEQQTQLDEEIRQWERQLNPEALKEMIQVNKEKMKEIKDKKLKLGAHQTQLKKLATHMIEFLFGDGDFHIYKEEIKEEFAKEYIYLLTEIELFCGDCLAVGEVFNEKADLILLLYDKYGREKEHLIYEIANMETDEELANDFRDYFE